MDFYVSSLFFLTKSPIIMLKYAVIRVQFLFIKLKTSFIVLFYVFHEKRILFCFKYIFGSEKKDSKRVFFIIHS